MTIKQPVANLNSYNQAIIADMIPWIIYHNAELDKWDNPVTIIERCDGKKFRMVHHSKSFHRRQRYTIYEGRNRFIKVIINKSDSDTQEDSVTAHRYTVAWGDGDNLEVTINEAISAENIREEELLNDLKNIQGNKYFEVILAVLNKVDMAEAWQSKEQKND